MKKLANLKGVRALNRMEQKSINGGGNGCQDECGNYAAIKTCPPYSFCQQVPCTWSASGNAYYCVGNGPGNQ